MWEKARVGWFWENSIEVCILPSAKSLQLCLTLCNPIDGSPPGSPVPGILQARTLEWVAISFSNAWNWKVKVKSLSHIWLLATPWTAAHQAPPSMGFSRQEYWSGVPLLSPFLILYITAKHKSTALPEILGRKRSTYQKASYHCPQNWLSSHPQAPSKYHSSLEFRSKQWPHPHPSSWK